MEQELLDELDVFVVYGLLTPAECALFIEETEHEEYTEAPLTTEHGPVHTPHVRNNRRVILDRDDWASMLWERFRTMELPWEDGCRPCGLNERFRFYRYVPGQFFAPHTDGYYIRPDRSAQSHYTVLVYLSEGFSGGETAFLDLGISVTPEAGMALVFRHTLSHEGAAVTEGTKYVLRTDLMFDLT